jgi:hypothetical protein
VPTGRSRLLAALADAHVEYVLVAGTGRRRLRLAVSAHPANLNALGIVLGQFNTTLRTAPAPRAGAVRRVGTALGVLRVHVPGVDVDLVIGGQGRSLYAELREVATEQDCDGVPVLVAPFLPESRTASDRSPERIAARLLALADELAKRVPSV